MFFLFIKIPYHKANTRTPLPKFGVHKFVFNANKCSLFNLKLQELSFIFITRICLFS